LKELRDEVRAIADLLPELDIMSVTTGDTNDDPTTHHPSATQCRSLLAELEKRTGKSYAKLWRMMQWPFSKDENARLFAGIGRCKESLIFALEMQQRDVIVGNLR